MGASGGYDGCDGLQSSPETGDLGCVWYTEAAGFAAGSRQIADKRSVARSAPAGTQLSGLIGTSKPVNPASARRAGSGRARWIRTAP
ncbi:hypothetical protein ALQ36_101969 [Pseudomonas syringae pv. primulae]|uniref:Uncharacterized protein n=1 Tax=Pseudomonas syringae pv. primulae TaxID=251707 RepID=A0A3M5TPN3_9PSED|nr:hypothetical protein ALQ36_101969 [Pseudomonas syringae pv. primulae]RMU35396.1 hypothetical protein ALP30_102159 [Pseudomonas syringae pv. primulae]